jgi:hypothetical protein
MGQQLEQMTATEDADSALSVVRENATTNDRPDASPLPPLEPTGSFEEIFGRKP